MFQDSALGPAKGKFPYLRKPGALACNAVAIVPAMFSSWAEK